MRVTFFTYLRTLGCGCAILSPDQQMSGMLMLPGAESSLCMGCIMFSSAESECAPHMQHVMDRRQMGIGDMPWLMLSGMACISVGHQPRGMERWSAKESNMYSSYFTRDMHRGFHNPRERNFITPFGERRDIRRRCVTSRYYGRTAEFTRPIISGTEA